MVWTAVGTLGGGGSSSSGSNGQQGPRGQDGATWLNGLGAPSLLVGKVGDFYLQNSNGQVWQKVNTLWGAPPQWIAATNVTGPAGKAGAAGTNGQQGLPGQPGIAGNDGAVGQTGIAQAVPARNGQDGATWLLGNQPPSVLQGKVGDFFFQAAPAGSAGPILLPGPQGLPGPAGQRGNNGLNVKSDGGLFTVPTIGQFPLTSLVNGTTLTSGGSSLWMYQPNTNTNAISYAVKPVPTAPYSCIFYLKGFLPGANFSSHGVIWWDSVNSNLKCLQNVQSTGLNLECGKGVGVGAAINADYVVMASSIAYNWFRLRDDGTNQTYSVSPDGENWVVFYTQARNTDVTPTHVGFHINCRNAISQPAGVALMSYQETG